MIILTTYCIVQAQDYSLMQFNKTKHTLLGSSNKGASAEF